MELEEFKRALTEGIGQLLGSGAFEAAAGHLGEVRTAVAGLGEYAERVGASLDRMDLADERAALEGLLGDIEGAGDDPWPLGNVLVGVSNVAIGIQNMARSSPARDLAHLVGSLQHFGAVQLAAQIGDAIYNGLLNLWQASSQAQWLGQTANELLAIERPEGVSANVQPGDDEHAGVMAEIEAAMNELGAVQPANGRDDSAHLAGQIGIAFEGSADGGGDRGGQGGEGGGAPAFDWDAVDWGALSAANGAVAKAASNDDRLAYVAVGGVVLVGPDHPRDLVQAVAQHPESYDGTIQVRSARLGAGTIRVEGCPAGSRDLFEQAMATFSRKSVEFR